jgi:phosphodiesterase/alkaline phosphatase D-like protein
MKKNYPFAVPHFLLSFHSYLQNYYTHNSLIMKGLCKKLLGIFLIFLIPQFAQAQKIWTGAIDNNWSNAANWTPTGVPTAGESVFFGSLAIRNCAINVPAQVFNFNIDSNCNISISVNANLRVNGDFTQETQLIEFQHSGFHEILGNLNILGGGFVATGAGTLVVNNLTIGVSGAMEHPSSLLRITGNVNVNGTLSVPTGSDTEFQGATASTISTNLTVYNLTINKNQGISVTNLGFVQLAVNNNVTLTNGRMDGSANSLFVQGDVAVGTGFDGGTGGMVFNGFNDQTLSFLGGTNLFTGDITVNKSGLLNLPQGMRLAGATQKLNLVLGRINLTGGDLILETNASLSGGSTSSYIIPNQYYMGKRGVSGRFLFPIGTATAMAPFEVFTTTTEIIFVNYLDINTPIINNRIASPLVRRSLKEYWNVAMPVNVNNVNVRLYYQSATASEIDKPEDLKIAYWNQVANSFWNDFGVTDFGNTSIGSNTFSYVENIVPTVLRTGVYTFGSSSSPSNILANTNIFNCADALLLDVQQSAQSTLFYPPYINGSTSLSGSCNGTIAYDAWYKVIGNGRTISIQYNNTESSGMAMEVFEGDDCTSLVPRFCGQSIGFGDNVAFDLPTTSGLTYKIRLSALSGAGADFKGQIYVYDKPNLRIEQKNPLAQNIYQNTTIPIGRISVNHLNIEGTARISGLRVSTQGTYVASDLKFFSLYYSTDDTFEQGRDQFITNQSSNSVGTGETLNFNFNFNSFPLPWNPSDEILHFFVVVDINDNATPGHTIQVLPITSTSAFRLSVPDATTSAFPINPDGGVLTITELTPDVCFGALDVSLGDCNVSFDILDSYGYESADPVDCNPSITGFKDAWFRFSTLSPIVSIEYSNLNEDVALVLYEGSNCLGSITEVACANNINGSGTEVINYNTNAEGDYLVRIIKLTDNTNPVNGFICLRTSAPVNDLASVNVNTFIVGNAAQSFPILASMNNREGRPTPNCTSDSNLDGWQKFVATASFTTVEYQNTSKNAAIAIYDGSPFNNLLQEEIFCADDRPASGRETLTFATTIGQTYYVRIMNVLDNNTMNGNFRVFNALPTTPTGLTSIETQQNQVTLHWNGALFTSSPSNGYRLDVSTVANFTSFVSGYQNLSVSDTTQIVSGLAPGTTYFFRVRGANDFGISANSVVFSQITIPATPVANNASNIQGISFTANWTAVSGHTEYLLDVAKTPTFDAGTFIQQDLSISQALVSRTINTDIEPGTIYYYRLRARNASGFSPYSNVITLISRPIANPATGLTDTQFTANWIAVNGATEYRLDVSSDINFGSFLANFQDLAINVANVSQVVTGLVSGTTYYYRIRAVASGGTVVSPNSNVVTVITIAPIPNALPASNNTQTSFRANWDLVNEADIYRLDVSTLPDFSTFVLGFNNRNAGSVTEFNVTGLTAGTTYYYRVRSVNEGGISQNSNVITTQTIPTTPVAQVASNIQATEFTANWTSSPIGLAGFRIDVALNDAFTQMLPGYNRLDVGNVNSLIISGLSPGVTYYYRLYSYNTGGTSAPSNNISVITTPAAPVALAASDITQSVFNARWEVVPGANSYALDIGLDANFDNFLAGYQGKTVANIVEKVEGLSASTTYFYRVRAVNSGGTSANSNVIQVTTLADIPAAPVADPATNVANISMTANWQVVSGATAYFLDVSDNQNFTNFIVGFQNLNVGNNLAQPITGLVAGTTYYYRVRAGSTGGTSGNSNVISQITLPNAPTAQTASPIFARSFTARWTSVTGAETYSIDVSTDANFAPNTFVDVYSNLDTGNVNQLIISNLSPSITYFYRLRAINDGGNGVSGYSNTIQVTTTIDVPNAPLALDATNFGQTSFTANWQAVSNVDTYEVQLSLNTNFTNFTSINAGNNLSVNVNGLNSGIIYFYRVIAKNATGDSDFSNVISQITVPANPQADDASNITLIIGNSSFRANWLPSPGASTYFIDVATDISFNSNAILSNYNNVEVGNANNLIINGLNLGQTYFYRLRAANLAGVSNNSNVISVNLSINPNDLPTAPSALSTFAISPTELEISFTDNSNNETGFELQRADNLSGPFVTIQTTPAVTTPAPNTIRLLDAGLTPITTYFYRVRATGSLGNSAFTTPVAGSTASDAPEAPSNLFAFTLSSTEVLLNWEDNSEDEDGFYIYRRTGQAEFARVATVGADITQYIDANLTPLTAYLYRITAFKGSSESTPSNLDGAFTSPVPRAPSNLNATATGTRTVELTWVDNSAQEDSLVVEMASIFTNGVFLPIAVLPRDAVNLTVNESITDLEPSQFYAFRVIATNDFGESPPSNVDTTTTFIDPTIPKPNRPLEVRAEPVSTIEIELRWRDNSNNELAFVIQRAEDEAGPYEFLDYTIAGTTNYNDIGVQAGETYYYRVFAINGGGFSLSSDTASAQAICNIISIINTDLPNNGSIACDSKEILLSLNTNVTQGDFQWYKNNLPIPEATLSSYITNETGEYYCRIKVDDCIKNSEIKSVIITPSFEVDIFLDETGDQPRLIASRLGAQKYQWYFDYRIINGAVTDSYTPMQSGVYYVIVTDGGCSATSRPVFYTITGNEEFNISNQIKMSPNPTTGKVNVELVNGLQGKYEINLIDLQGKIYPLVSDNKDAFELRTQLDLDKFAQGMYFLEVRIGKYAGRKKLVRY